MLYNITGKLIYIDMQSVAIECSGVGFKCFVTLNTLRNLPKIGNTVTLFTYLNVREDALDLYGFYTVSEMDCFKMLLLVSGVGPRVALGMLSDFTAQQIAMAIASGDAKTLTKASGVGPKLAQRLVLELKDKVSGMNLSNSEEIQSVSNVFVNSNVNEAAMALVSLGYNQSGAMALLSQFDKSLSVEKLISLALKAGGKNGI